MGDVSLQLLYRHDASINHPVSVVATGEGGVSLDSCITARLGAPPYDPAVR